MANAENLKTRPSSLAGQGGQSSLARPPVVVIMGHVDHGKTTLLDHIRSANVAAREAGGITQSISAYEILRGDRRITFIDTPGHEAFTKMRSRGAAIADIAILVVAAEEGPKPQTIEAIQIIKETKTPYIVALTKIDKSAANIDKVKNDLFAAGVELEGYGGQVSFQAVSAKTGEGVNDLLDLILLTAEVENPTYDPGAPASGFVLEARRSKQRGQEVVVIVKNGILRQGDLIKTPSASGKVKMLEDFAGRAVKELTPSAPALIVGFEDLPQVGDIFVVGEGDSLVVGEAKAIAETGPKSYDSADEDYLNLILKSSDSGSLEALSGIVRALPTTLKPIRVVAESIGDVAEGDVQLAISTRSAIICFKCKATKSAQFLAETRDVRILTSEIVYELVQAIENDLLRDKRELGSGELDVLALFNQARLSEQLVGGRVATGTFRDRRGIEIRRDNKSIGQGKIISMREKKEAITSANEGQEIGVVLEAGIKIEVGDKLVIK